jgi:nicotinamide mononucleotide transporter
MIAPIQRFLSIENIAFTVIGYPMSYVELFGTMLTLWSVWLIAKRRVLTWPVGIVSSVLFLVLFYQIKLYSDTIEQIYYIITNIYGWWAWEKSPQDNGQVIGVRYSHRNRVTQWIVLTLIVSAIVGYLMSRIHLLLPTQFPEPAAFPYLDALTTIMSFTATWLMIQKKVECWIYWIIVDVIGIGLYFNKEVKFVALLYVVLLVLAINGFWLWHRTFKAAISESKWVS